MITAVVAPFDQLYVKGAVPPCGVKLITPFAELKQEICVEEAENWMLVGGCVIEIIEVVVQAFASVTVTE